MGISQGWGEAINIHRQKQLKDQSSISACSHPRVTLKTFTPNILSCTRQFPRSFYCSYRSPAIILVIKLVIYLLKLNTDFT